MAEKEVTRNSPRAWILAARPKTLAGASVPVMIGLAAAWADLGGDGFKPVAALLCMLFAFVMQIDANFVNDYFDFLNGNDTEERLGPQRACAMGWISASQMRRGILATTLLACLVGLPLILYGGLQMVLIGGVCVLFCFLYTTCMAQRGLGDVLVLVFFGILPVCITYYIQTGAFTWQVFIASVACGLVVDTLLVVNNYRDIDNDRQAGKNTLIVMIGPAAGRHSYLGLGITACLMGAVYLTSGHLWAFALPLLYLLLHVAAYRRMTSINRGRELNLVLADTARNMFIYGLCVSLGIII